MAIDFHCPSCRQAYRVKDEYAGRSTKCKKCGSAILVPKPAPRELESLAATGTWLDNELSAPPPAAKPVTPPRPVASQPAATRKKSTASRSKALKLKLPSFGDSAILRLARGVLFSCLGAFVGALAWAAIAIMTGFQLGIVAWGVGLAAGGGMAIGYEDDDGMIPGVLAAFIAMGGIILAKIFIVVWLAASVLSSGAAIKTEMVAARLADEALAKRGIDPDAASEAEFEVEYDKAMQAVAGLADEQLDRIYSESMSRLAKQQSPAGSIPQPPVEPAAEPPGEQPEPRIQIQVTDQREGSSIASLFFQSMFRPIDGLFILLAFASAYKVGSGSIGG